jgi:cell division protein ZapA
VNKFKTSISSMQELIPINVVIGDRTYRIKIEPADEELVRKTLKTMNDKIIEYKTQFAGKDMQDYIAMVLLWYATLASSGDASPGLSSSVLESLTRMEQQLDRAL